MMIGKISRLETTRKERERERIYKQWFEYMSNTNHPKEETDMNENSGSQGGTRDINTRKELR